MPAFAIALLSLLMSFPVPRSSLAGSAMRKSKLHCLTTRTLQIIAYYRAEELFPEPPPNLEGGRIKDEVANSWLNGNQTLVTGQIGNGFTFPGGNGLGFRN